MRTILQLKAPSLRGEPRHLLLDVKRGLRRRHVLGQLSRGPAPDAAPRECRECSPAPLPAARENVRRHVRAPSCISCVSAKDIGRELGEQQGPSTSATPFIIPQRRIPQRRRARRGRNGGAACHSCSNGSHAILVVMGRDRGGFHELNGRIELFGVRSVRCCGLGSRAEISIGARRSRAFPPHSSMK